MASPVASRFSRLPSYSGTPATRLWRSPGLRFIPLLMLCALFQGGCAMSYRLDSLFGKETEQKEITGSVSDGSFAAASTTDLLEADLAYARAAATDILARGSKDTSASWENPSTGARGTVTPIATSYTLDGHTCRDFLASYIRKSSQAWLHGEACRLTAGHWEVKNLVPFKRT